MPNTVFQVPHSIAATLSRGEALRKFLSDERHGFRLAVTLNANAPTTIPRMQRALSVLYSALNRKTDRAWYKKSRATWWAGHAFLEGHEAEANDKVTLHWHVLIGPGPALCPHKYADQMTSTNPLEPILSETHLRREWIKLYPRGSVDVQSISDLEGWVRYCTKDMCNPGPNVRRAHETYTPLPLR